MPLSGMYTEDDGLRGSEDGVQSPLNPRISNATDCSATEQMCCTFGVLIMPSLSGDVVT